MKTIKISALIVLFTGMMLCAACKKDWLDAKPNKALVVPSTVADYQALLDDNSGGATPMNINYPCISMVGDGDYSITDATYNALGYQAEQGAYIWAATADFYDGQASSDWINAYARILTANVVLDGIPSLKIDASSQSAFNNVKGSALFFRSYDFYNLSQQYCKVYDASTANTDLGLPLRLSSNVNLTVKRASVQQTYDQMTIDLQQAAPLLPVTPLYPTRPSKPAVYGLLARVYLAQENYNKALLYADSCLQLQGGLMDLNQMTPTLYSPFQQFNKEVVFSAELAGYASLNPKTKMIVDSSLYKSYDPNDLRLIFYFFTNRNRSVAFQGSYFGFESEFFGGIATDEMYLTRAECYARTGNTNAALTDLNTLLENRYKTGTFTNLTAANADAALALIVAERRKELCFRNLRWSDLRRLNKDPRFQVTLTRIVNGQTITLPPNSPKYVLPLDPVETTTGGLQQNPR
jgi:hypothetical protein